MAIDNAYSRALTEQVLRAVTEIQQQFIVSAEPGDAFALVLKSLLELTDSGYGFIGEIRWSSAGAPYLKTYAVTDISWDAETKAFFEAHAPGGLEFHNLQTLFGYTVSTGELLLTNDPGANPRSGGLPHGHPSLHRYAGIPLHRRDRFIGMLGIANRPAGYDITLIEALEPFLQTCATLIEANQENLARRAADASLRKAEEQLHRFANHIPLIIFSLDTEGRFTLSEGAGLESLGRTPGEVVGRTLADVHAHNPTIGAAYERALTGTTTVALTQIGERTFEATYTPIRDGAGAIEGVTGVADDVTERTAAERRLERFFDVSIDLLCVAGFDGYFKLVNPRFSETLGFTVDELLAQPFLAFVHPDDLAPTTRELERLAHGAVAVAFQNRYRTRDGSYRWLEWNARASGDEVYAGARDVTQLRLSEARDAADLSVAKRVQRSMLAPPSGRWGAFDIEAFCEAATAVGGDFYDWSPTRTGAQLYLAVGDVMGKGAPAAILMAAMQMALRSALAATDDGDIALMVNRATEQLADVLAATDAFITAFVGLLDASGRLRFVNAGHGQALVRRLDGRLEAIGGPGFPIGAVPGYRFEAGEAWLRPGDRLVIFSDGLIDCVPLDGTAQQIAWDTAGSVVQSVRKRAEAAAPADDDQTIMVLGFDPADAYLSVDAASAFEATMSPLFFDLEQCGARITHFLTVSGVAEPARLRLVTAIHELLANVAEHARPRSEVTARIRLSACLAAVEIRYVGLPFAVEGELSGLTLPDAHAERGRGLYIVSELTQQLRYERTASGNRWTFVASIDDGEDPDADISE